MLSEALPVIRICNLSKRFQIEGKARYRSLREGMVRGLWTLFSRKEQREWLWAIDDISLDVHRGEVVGIIGRNGAGKSTFLKLLSRVTRPTSGRIEIWGRVGSLLEVGTGFHPELTGRENIFLSGAILGMKRTEILERFEQIVEFSGVEKFLDTPVKRYSSGMYVRLGFSVAAHMEPDILVVDEVLAVGDLVFQQKCLQHMRQLTRSGMTVLLVSHNLAAVQSTCDRAILIECGKVVEDGAPIEVIEKYRDVLTEGRSSQRGEGGTDTDPVIINGFSLFDRQGAPTRRVRFGESVGIRIEVDSKIRIRHPMINFGIKRGDGVIVCNFNNWYDGFKIDYLEGPCVLEGQLPPLRLTPGFYEIHVLVWPWGGGHLAGDLERMSPYAARTFGDFQVVGVGLNNHDGVFQIPAQKWLFRRGSVEFCQEAGEEDAVFEAFSEELALADRDGVTETDPGDPENDLR